MRRRTPLLLLAVLAFAAGCTSSGSAVQPTPTFSPDPKLSELIRTADLDRCPTTGSSVTSGGLPDVTLPCLGTGPAVHLAALRGRPTVVNMWGSWCIPCRKETKYLAQVYDSLKPRIGILGVDTEDTRGSALDFAAHVTPPMRYPSVVDDDRSVLVALHTSVVPVTVMVDAQGRVVHRSFGPYHDAASLRADISRYLGVS